MPLLNKEKMMSGFEKAVDVVNDKADKAARYAKENKWDKKIDNFAGAMEKGLTDMGNDVKKFFKGK